MNTMKRSGILLLAVTAIFCLMPSPGQGGGGMKLVIGSKEFTEQRILGQIMIALLEENGFQCVDKTALGGTRVIREALLKRQIDIYMEYTGTALSAHLNIGVSLTDPRACYETVRQTDLERHNLVWLSPMPFSNTYCLMMTRKKSEALRIKTISALAEYVSRYPNALIFGLNAEFFTRIDGYPSLQHEYKLRFPRDSIIKMGLGLLYSAVGKDYLQVALGYSTDGRIKAFDLFLLEDDEHFFPPYNPAPVLHRDIAEKCPELKGIFERLSEKLDDKAMVNLNYEADIEGVPVRDVARNWLKREGLL